MQSNNKEDSSDKRNCIGCTCELTRDHVGIMCPQAHDVCTDCSPQFVNKIMSDCEVSIPVKCMVCTQPVHASTFERQLDQAQSEIYRMYVIMKEIGADETMNSCPFCTYFIITLKSHSMNFFFCK